MVRRSEPRTSSTSGCAAASPSRSRQRPPTKSWPKTPGNCSRAKSPRGKLGGTQRSGRHQRTGEHPRRRQPTRNQLPVNTVPPTVSVEPSLGSTLTCSTGTWQRRTAGRKILLRMAARKIAIEVGTKSSYTSRGRRSRHDTHLQGHRRKTRIGVGRAKANRPSTSKASSRKSKTVPTHQRRRRGGRNAHLLRGYLGSLPQTDLQLPLARRHRDAFGEQLRDPESRQGAPAGLRSDGHQRRREHLGAERGDRSPCDSPAGRHRSQHLGGLLARSRHGADLQQQMVRRTRTDDHLRVADQRRADRRRQRRHVHGHEVRRGTPARL